MKKILLTGASGFLGKRIAQYLKNSESKELSLVYRKNEFCVDDKQFCVGDINKTTDFSASLSGQDVVIHTAARVHIMREGSVDPLSQFRMVNVEGTLNLAAQAIEAGVQRFIFLSSIKVNGETTLGQDIFSELDIPNPQDPYALSKYEAERGLLDLANRSDMQLVIIRPPLTYGPGVKGNFAVLIKLILSGLPLPIGLIKNKRSLMALDNLVDLIVTCIDHPNAADQIFLASDGKNVSTLELVKKIATTYNVKTYVFPVPVILMKLIFRLIGKINVADRLFNNLQIDGSKAERLLDWKAVISMEDQLKEMAVHYNQERTNE